MRPPGWRSRTHSRRRSQHPPGGSRGELHSQNSCLVDGSGRGLGTLGIQAARYYVRKPKMKMLITILSFVWFCDKRSSFITLRYSMKNLRKQIILHELDLAFY